MRAEGSTGQVEGGGEDGACWTGVEDVLPSCMYLYLLLGSKCLDSRCNEYRTEVSPRHRSTRTELV